jgi:Mrp family chromosome partitioning ATPase
MAARIERAELTPAAVVPIPVMLPADPKPSVSMSGIALTLGAAVAGGILGGGVGLLAARRRNPEPRRQPSPEPFPILGELPLANSDVEPSDGSSLANALRSVRAGLIGGPFGRTIYVTGHSCGAGVSSVVLGLAAALSAAGRAVLTVDANFYRPGLHRRAGLEDSLKGLFDVLTGDVDVTDAICSTGSASLSVLPAGRITADPSDVLASPALGAIVDGMGRSFDYVLVDCPPLETPSTLPMLASARDVILVVDHRFRHDSSRLAGAAALGSRLKGQIINRVPHGIAPKLPPRASAQPKRLAR